MRGLILSVILIITISLRVVGAFVLRVHTAYITGRLSTTMTTSSGRSIARHSIMYATNDKGNDPAQHEWNPSWSAIGGSDMYSEERPRRLVLPNKESGHSDQYREERFSNDWGIQRIQGPRVEFPSTIEDVTEQAFEAIAATLYGKQRMDPNLVRNAVKGDTVHGRRPVRSRKDSGRIGIEIAGAKYLFVKSARLENLSPEVTAVVDAFALRRVALTLASKLTRGHWIGFEPKPQSPKYHRPVILYFNQVKQALAASQDLSLLRRKAMLSDCPGIYDNITIVSMSGDAKIPKELCNGHQKQRKHTMLPSGGVDPSRGILVFVQPTDYNEESRPPGPAVGAFEAFQKLVACAAIEELPVLCISPRFLAIDNTHSIHHWDQSGFQQSSTYGGVEPPRGPTPWILRDFIPPAFCWIGNSLSLNDRASTSNLTVIQGYPSNVQYKYSRLCLVQSVMHEGHAWHLFACHEDRLGYTQLDSASTTRCHFQYLASTKNAAGRPTRSIMRRIFDEFAT